MAIVLWGDNLKKYQHFSSIISKYIFRNISEGDNLKSQLQIINCCFVSSNKKLAMNHIPQESG